MTLQLVPPNPNELLKTCVSSASVVSVMKAIDGFFFWVFYVDAWGDVVVLHHEDREDGFSTPAAPNRVQSWIWWKRMRDFQRPF